MEASLGMGAKGLRKTFKEPVLCCKGWGETLHKPFWQLEKDKELGAKSARRKGTVKYIASRHHSFLN